MIRKTSRSAAGVALSMVIGVGNSLPVFAQQSPGASAQPDVVPNQQQQQQLLNQPATAPIPENAQPGARQGEAYTLGAGDIVRVDIFDITPELALEARYTILPDGTLNLPWVGSVPLAGLSLSQAANVLSQRFGRFIRNPVITVSLLAPRPLKVGVIGEVNRPGAYIISVISNEVSQTSLNQRTASEGGNQWPRVSQAIQTAGGITGLANLREIRVRRPRVNGGEELIAINLWQFLSQGDLNQDILLRDGDTIVIPRAATFNPEEVTQVATSNFSPQTIAVSVVGEVGAPGTIQVRPNTTLNQAILAAGGFRGGRASRRNVDLIRLNPDGSVSRRKMAIDLDQSLNEERNPRLFNNDIVVVNRTLITKVNDFLVNAIGAPLTIFSGISGFRSIINP